MDLKPKLVALVASAIFAVAGCSTPESAAPIANSPAPTPTTQAAGTPIDGDWLSRLTREQITDQLEEAGLSKWTEEFLKHQNIVKLQIAVYTFDGGRFAVAYLDEHDGTWKVGWKGSYSVADDQVTMHDELNDVTDVYRWEVSEAGLDLDRVGSDTETVDGFPNEVFDAAYLSDSWTPTDCPMETDKPC
jgi:hypothetical protein